MRRKERRVKALTNHLDDHRQRLTKVGPTTTLYYSIRGGLSRRIASCEEFRSLPRDPSRMLLILRLCGARTSYRDVLKELRNELEYGGSIRTDGRPIEWNEAVVLQAKPLQTWYIEVIGLPHVIHISISPHEWTEPAPDAATRALRVVESAIIRVLDESLTGSAEISRVISNALNAEEFRVLQEFLDDSWQQTMDFPTDSYGFAVARSVASAAELTQLRRHLTRKLTSMRNHVHESAIHTILKEMDACGSILASRIAAYSTLQQQQQIEALAERDRKVGEMYLRQDRLLAGVAFLFIPPSLYVAALSYADIPEGDLLARWATVVPGIAIWGTFGFLVYIIVNRHIQQK